MFEDCIEKFSCNKYPKHCSEKCYRPVIECEINQINHSCCEDNLEVFPNIRYVEGPAGRDGKDGKDGKSLEFTWTEDQLGTRLEGAENYEYSKPLTGPQGPQGNVGEQGNTPYIGENGNWWIGNTDTGVYAKPSNKAEDLIPGKLKQGMSCEEPTQDDELVNRKYLNNTTIPNTVISNFWVGTQSAYDAIETKNEKTLYLIQE